MRDGRGWAAPAVTAAAVVALVLGVHALVTGGPGGGGPSPDEVERVVDPPTPTPRAVDLSRDVASLTGYRADGDRLVLGYTLRYPDCQVIQVQATVSESPDRVVVRLQQVPMAEQPLPDCSGRPMARRVVVTLRQPLADRPVVDRSRGERAVPALG